MENMKNIFSDILARSNTTGLEDANEIVSAALSLGVSEGAWVKGEYEQLSDRSFEGKRETVYIIGLHGIRGADSCFFKFNVTLPLDV